MDKRTDREIIQDIQNIVDESYPIRPPASMSVYRRLASQNPNMLVERIHTLEVQLKLYQERNARLAKMNAHLNISIREALFANRESKPE